MFFQAVLAYVITRPCLLCRARFRPGTQRYAPRPRALHDYCGRCHELIGNTMCLIYERTDSGTRPLLAADMHGIDPLVVRQLVRLRFVSFQPVQARHFTDEGAALAHRIARMMPDLSRLRSEFCTCGSAHDYPWRHADDCPFAREAREHLEAVAAAVGLDGDEGPNAPEPAKRVAYRYEAWRMASGQTTEQE